MNLPLPEADAATTAEVRDWLDRFAACVRDVDYAAARPFCHPDVVIFGTYQELVKACRHGPSGNGTMSGRARRSSVLTWRTRWSWRRRMAQWRSRSLPGPARVSMRTASPSIALAALQSYWRGRWTAAGLVCIRTCHWRAACHRIAMGKGR